MDKVLERLVSRNYTKLTKSQKRIAEYIIRNPDEAAFLSAKALGKKVNVSDATVIRLSNALGISGFAELQKILQSQLKGKLASSEKLKHTRIARRSDIYSLIFDSSIKNILKAQGEVSTSKLDEVTKVLDSAKKIFVMGLRRSHSLAFHLYYNLSRILNKVFLIESAYGIKYDQITEIGIHDVLVTVSFPRYTKETLEVTKIAKRKGATIIAITDNSLSPIGQLADISLFWGYDSPFFFGSHAGALVIVDCIIGGLSLRHRKRYVDRLAELEETLRKFGVWVK